MSQHTIAKGLIDPLKTIFLSSKINVLLLFIPIGYIVHFVSSNSVLIFVINFFAIIPSAHLLGFATEELAESVGQTLGGLLNATFGNAVELIIAIVALFHGQIRVVQASMLGSVLSNILLVLGTCFLFGGIVALRDKNNKTGEQEFSQTAAQASSSLMTLACITLILPAAFSLSVNGNSNTSTNTSSPDSKILYISYGTSIVLLVIYMLYLLFELKTHKDLFLSNEEYVVVKEDENKKPKDIERGIGYTGDTGDIGEPSNKSEGQGHENEQENESKDKENESKDKENESKDKESGKQVQAHENEQTNENKVENGNLINKENHLSVMSSLILLVVITVIIAFSAEFLVGSIEGIVSSSGISETFIGLILLPIVGNAAEHVTSVTVAMQNKMNLAIGVSVGSSTQIALFVTPLLVILGWIVHQPMSLYFLPFETICLFIAVLLTNYLVQDGRSNWLEGALLIATYIIMALAFFFYPD